MCSATTKHRVFVTEPMGEKPVDALPGIGDTLGKILTAKGFGKAYMVLGKFLMLKKNERRFCDWLNETCGANAEQQRDCFKCLKEYCDGNL